MPRLLCDLDCASDLATIRMVCKQHFPGADDRTLGLAKIAKLCRRRTTSRSFPAPHAMRQELLTIAADWDLSRDRLDAQSDDCIRRIAEIG
jgi:hypothetical protein